MTYFDEAATDINRFQERRAESKKMGANQTNLLHPKVLQRD